MTAHARRRGVDYELAFVNKVAAFAERDDISPLVEFMRSAPAPTPLMLSVSAEVMALLHARARPGKEGRPGGKYLRWQIPEYVAAYLVDQRMQEWRSQNGKTRVPDKDKTVFVDAVLDEMKGWALLHGKRRIKRGRVLTLLREAKHLRL